MDHQTKKSEIACTYHQFLLVENEMERATKEFLRSRNKSDASLPTPRRPLSKKDVKNSFEQRGNLKLYTMLSNAL